MIDFINNGYMFYGDAEVFIDDFHNLAKASALYRAHYKTKEMHGYIPELVFLHLSSASFLGDTFLGVKYHPLSELGAHLRDGEILGDICIDGVYQHNETKYNIICKRDNYFVNDRLQILDGCYNAPCNLRLKREDGELSPCPVQMRIIEANQTDKISCLTVETGTLARPLIPGVDKFCVLPSFKAGGICGVNGENPMLLVYPYA